MSRAIDDSTKSRLRPAFGLCITIAVMIGGWILMVGGIKPHEMMVGAVAVGATTFFLYMAKRTEPLRLRFEAHDVIKGWSVPWYLATDIAIITVALVKDILHSKRPKPQYRTCKFRTAKAGPVLAARGVLAAMYTTTTPNSIVVGIDDAQGRILLHQLKPTDLTPMMRELGAREFDIQETAGSKHTANKTHSHRSGAKG